MFHKNTRFPNLRHIGLLHTPINYRIFCKGFQFSRHKACLTNSLRIKSITLQSSCSLTQTARLNTCSKLSYDNTSRTEIELQLSNTVVEGCLKKIECHLSTADAKAAVDELQSVFRCLKETKTRLDPFVDPVIDQFFSSKIDPKIQLEALEWIIRRQFFKEDFETEQISKFFWGRVLLAASKTNLFSKKEQFGMEFRTVVKMAGKCLGVIEFEEFITRVVRQVEKPYQNLAYNLAICSLEVRRSNFIHVSITVRLFDMMVDQKLQPSSETYFWVLERLLGSIPKGDTSTRGKFGDAIDIYQNHKKHVSGLSQKTYISLMLAINTRLTKHRELSGVLIEVMHDFIAQHCVMPLRIAAFLIQGLFAITNGYTNHYFSASYIVNKKTSREEMEAIWAKLRENESLPLGKSLDVLLTAYLRSSSNFPEVLSASNKIALDYLQRKPQKEEFRPTTVLYAEIESAKGIEELFKEMHTKEHPTEIEIQKFNLLMAYEIATGNNRGALVWLNRVSSTEAWSHPDTWCYGIMASLRTGTIGDTRRYIDCLLNSNKNNPLTEMQYLTVIEGLKVFFSDRPPLASMLTQDLVNWALDQSKYLLDHMDRTNYTGARDEVYTALLKNLSTYITNAYCVNPPLNYGIFLRIFDSRIRLHSIVPDPSLITFAFNAMGTMYRVYPKTKQILEDMEVMFEYLTESGTELKPHTFVALFQSLGVLGNQEMLRAYYIKLCKLGGCPTLIRRPEWIGAFNTCLRHMYVSPEGLFTLLCSMRAFGVTPNSETLLNLLTQSAKVKAPLEAMKSIISAPKSFKNFDTSDGGVGLKLLVKIVTSFYKVGGVSEAVEAVEYVLTNFKLGFDRDNLPPSFYKRIINMSLTLSADFNIDVALDWTLRLKNCRKTKESIDEFNSAMDMLEKLPPAVLETLTQDQNDLLYKLGFDNPHKSYN